MFQQGLMEVLGEKDIQGSESSSVGPGAQGVRTGKDSRDVGAQRSPGFRSRKALELY